MVRFGAAFFVACALGSIVSVATTDAWKPWNLKAPAPVADEIPASLENWKELDCARCHAVIGEEWAGSRHALAWVNERYQEELGDMKRPESCHGCHAPEPLIPATVAGKPPQKPKARDLAPQSGDKREADVHFGVSCASCHLASDGAMLGPFGAPTKAHASRRDPLFAPESASALCIACHATSVGPVTGIAKDFADTDASKAGKSCVACHMQPIERAIAAEDGGPVLAPRAGRSHALQTPRDPTFLRRAFAFSAQARGDEVVVLVRNECGHRIPGLLGRKITIDVELQDESGHALATSSSSIEKSASLAIDATLEMVLAGRGTRVKLHGTHAAPGFDAAVNFLDETLVLAR